MCSPADPESTMIKVARLEERLMASDKALDLARASLTAWQSASNEWRQENIDQRAMFMTIDKAQSLVATEAALRASLEGRIWAIEQARQVDVGKQAAFSSTWAITCTVITIIISATALAIKFIH